MKKKLIILVILFLATGCSARNLNEMSIEECAEVITKSEVDLYSVNNIGYRYYLPRGYKVINDLEYNEILYSKGYKYYLYIDTVSYYNNTSPDFIEDSNAYISKKLSGNNKTGYLEINKQNNKFFIEMMYNYAKIEVLVDEKDIKESVTNISYILSSVKYNKNVIKNMVDEDVLNFKEKDYKLAQPKKEVESKNILDYAKEYDNYKDVNNELPDTDMIDSNK